MFALNDKAYATSTAVSNACDFPVLNDTAQAGAFAKLAVPGKEYVYVWDTSAKLVSFFKPWEIGLSNGANVDKLESLLAALAK
jgi:hypothetical protein